MYTYADPPDRVGHVVDAVPGVALAALPAARRRRVTRRGIRAARRPRGAVRPRVGAHRSLYAGAARDSPAAALRLLSHLRARRLPQYSALLCRQSHSLTR